MSLNQRLTVDLREIILNSVMKDAFKERQDKIEGRKRAFVMKVRRLFVSEAQEAKLVDVEKQFLTFCETLRGYINDGDRANNRPFEVTLEHGVVTPAALRDWHGRCAFGEVSNPKLAAEWDKIEDAQNDLNRDRGDLRERTKCVLLGCSNVRRLLETWPEVKPFIPAWAFEEVKKANLPAVVVKDITAELRRAGVELPKAA